MFGIVVRIPDIYQKPAADLISLVALGLPLERPLSVTMDEMLAKAEDEWDD